MYWDGTPGSCKRGDACIFADSHRRGKATASNRDAAAANGGGGGSSNGRGRAGAPSPRSTSYEEEDERLGYGGAMMNGSGAKQGSDLTGYRGVMRKAALSEVGRQPGQAPNLKRRQQRENRLQVRTAERVAEGANGSGGGNSGERAAPFGRGAEGRRDGDRDGGGDGRKALLARASRGGDEAPRRRERLSEVSGATAWGIFLGLFCG